MLCLRRVDVCEVGRRVEGLWDWVSRQMGRSAIGVGGWEAGRGSGPTVQALEIPSRLAEDHEVWIDARAEGRLAALTERLAEVLTEVRPQVPCQMLLEGNRGEAGSLDDCLLG